MSDSKELLVEIDNFVLSFPYPLMNLCMSFVLLTLFFT